MKSILEPSPALTRFYSGDSGLLNTIISRDNILRTRISTNSSNVTFSKLTVHMLHPPRNRTATFREHVMIIPFRRSSDKMTWRDTKRSITQMTYPQTLRNWPMRHGVRSNMNSPTHTSKTRATITITERRTLPHRAITEITAIVRRHLNNGIRQYPCQVKTIAITFSTRLGASASVDMRRSHTSRSSAFPRHDTAFRNVAVHKQIHSSMRLHQPHSREKHRSWIAPAAVHRTSPQHAVSEIHTVGGWWRCNSPTEYVLQCERVSTLTHVCSFTADHDPALLTQRPDHFLAPYLRGVL